MSIKFKRKKFVWFILLPFISVPAALFSVYKTSSNFDYKLLKNSQKISNRYGNYFSRIIPLAGSKHAGIWLTTKNDEKDYLYLWGDNSQGQIGTNSIELKYNKPFLIDLEKYGITEKIFDVELYGNNTYVLTRDESNFKTKLYGWGSNLWHQIDISNEDNVIKPTLINIKNLPSEIIDIEAGDNTIFALALNNDLYSWGDSRNGKLGSSNSTSKHDTALLVESSVEKISISGNCGMLATRSNVYNGYGDIKIWGDNSQQQLPTNAGYVSIPQKIDEPKLENVGTYSLEYYTDFDASLYNTTVNAIYTINKGTSDERKVAMGFISGSNKHKQISSSDLSLIKEEYTPIINFPSNDLPYDEYIANPNYRGYASANKATTISETGTIISHNFMIQNVVSQNIQWTRLANYIWGNGNNYQLGNDYPTSTNDKIMLEDFTSIQAFGDDFVIKASEEPVESQAINVVSYGKNESGQLATGDFDERNKPYSIFLNATQKSSFIDLSYLSKTVNQITDQDIKTFVLNNKKKIFNDITAYENNLDVLNVWISDRNTYYGTCKATIQFNNVFIDTEKGLIHSLDFNIKTIAYKGDTTVNLNWNLLSTAIIKSTYGFEFKNWAEQATKKEIQNLFVVSNPVISDTESSSTYVKISKVNLNTRRNILTLRYKIYNYFENTELRSESEEKVIEFKDRTAFKSADTKLAKENLTLSWNNSDDTVSKLLNDPETHRMLQSFVTSKLNEIFINLYTSDSDDANSRKTSLKDAYVKENNSLAGTAVVSIALNDRVENNELTSSNSDESRFEILLTDFKKNMPTTIKNNQFKTTDPINKVNELMIRNFISDQISNKDMLPYNFDPLKNISVELLEMEPNANSRKAIVRINSAILEDGTIGALPELTIIISSSYENTPTKLELKTNAQDLIRDKYGFQVIDELFSANNSDELFKYINIRNPYSVDGSPTLTRLELNKNQTIFKNEENRLYLHIKMFNFYDQNGALNLEPEGAMYPFPIILSGFNTKSTNQTKNEFKIDEASKNFIQTYSIDDLINVLTPNISEIFNGTLNTNKYKTTISKESFKIDAKNYINGEIEISFSLKGTVRKQLWFENDKFSYKLKITNFKRNEITNLVDNTMNVEQDPNSTNKIIVTDITDDQIAKHIVNTLKDTMLTKPREQYTKNDFIISSNTGDSNNTTGVRFVNIVFKNAFLPDGTIGQSISYRLLISTNIFRENTKVFLSSKTTNYFGYEFTQMIKNKDWTNEQLSSFFDIVDGYEDPYNSNNNTQIKLYKDTIIFNTFNNTISLDYTLKNYYNEYGVYIQNESNRIKGIFGGFKLANTMISAPSFPWIDVDEDLNNITLDLVNKEITNHLDTYFINLPTDQKTQPTKIKSITLGDKNFAEGTISVNISLEGIYKGNEWLPKYIENYVLIFSVSKNIIATSLASTEMFFDKKVNMVTESDVRSEVDKQLSKQMRPTGFDINTDVTITLADDSNLVLGTRSGVVKINKGFDTMGNIVPLNPIKITIRSTDKYLQKPTSIKLSNKVIDSIRNEYGFMYFKYLKNSANFESFKKEIEILNPSTTPKTKITFLSETLEFSSEENTISIQYVLTNFYNDKGFLKEEDSNPLTLILKDFKQADTKQKNIVQNWSNPKESISAITEDAMINFVNANMPSLFINTLNYSNLKTVATSATKDNINYFEGTFDLVVKLNNIVIKNKLDQTQNRTYRIKITNAMRNELTNISEDQFISISKPIWDVTVDEIRDFVWDQLSPASLPFGFTKDQNIRVELTSDYENNKRYAKITLINCFTDSDKISSIYKIIEISKLQTNKKTTIALQSNENLGISEIYGFDLEQQLEENPYKFFIIENPYKDPQDSNKDTKIVVDETGTEYNWKSDTLTIVYWYENYYTGKKLSLNEPTLPTTLEITGFKKQKTIINIPQNITIDWEEQNQTNEQNIQIQDLTREEIRIFLQNKLDQEWVTNPYSKTSIINLKIENSDYETGIITVTFNIGNVVDGNTDSGLSPVYYSKPSNFKPELFTVKIKVAPGEIFSAKDRTSIPNWFYPLVFGIISSIILILIFYAIIRLILKKMSYRKPKNSIEGDKDEK